MLIWTKFNSLDYISNISSLLQKFHFQIEVVLNSLQTSFPAAFFVEFFDEIFSLVI